MMVTEEEFFRLYGAKQSFDSHLVFAWFEWRRKHYGEDKWNPKCKYCVKYDAATNEIVATGENFDEERFNASETYEVTPDKFYMLWHRNYYDGPLTGVAEYKGKYVWFSNHEWSGDNLFNVWTYEVFEMSEAAYQSELAWQERWLHVKKSGDAAYKKFEKDRDARPEVDYTQNKSLGIFDECLFDRTRMSR